MGTSRKHPLEVRPPTFGTNLNSLRGELTFCALIPFGRPVSRSGNSSRVIHLPPCLTLYVLSDILRACRQTHVNSSGTFPLSKQKRAEERLFAFRTKKGNFCLLRQRHESPFSERRKARLPSTTTSLSRRFLVITGSLRCNGSSSIFVRYSRVSLGRDR